MRAHMYRNCEKFVLPSELSGRKQRFEHCVHELRGVGVRRPFSGGVHPPRIQEGHGALPAFSRGIAPSFHATYGTESVCWSIGQRPHPLSKKPMVAEAIYPDINIAFKDFFTSQ